MVYFSKTLARNKYIDYTKLKREELCTATYAEKTIENVGKWQMLYFL